MAQRSVALRLRELRLRGGHGRGRLRCPGLEEELGLAAEVAEGGGEGAALALEDADAAVLARRGAAVAEGVRQ
jgi:hypothetical protein